MSQKAMQVYEGGSVAVTGIDDALSPQRLIEQVNLIQNVMKSVMKEGEHFGKIPGCGDKPTLLKPGAEKLCFTFRLRPEFDIEIVPTVHPIAGHREYRVRCRLFSITTGAPVGEGVGAASTLESKWRFRTGPTEVTDTPVPQAYWDIRKTDPEKAAAMIGGKGRTTKKVDGKWFVAVQGEKVENENPADVYNTVLKMAKKRANVDAVITATAASDIFTQDVEELVENGVIQTGADAGAAAKPAASMTPKSNAETAGTTTAAATDDLAKLKAELDARVTVLSNARGESFDDALFSVTSYTKDGKTRKGLLKEAWQYKAAIKRADDALVALEGTDEPGAAAGQEDIPF